MKNTLPSLILLWATAWLTSTAQSAAPDAAPQAPSEGQRLVRQAAATVTQYESLQARVRQRVHLFDRKLAGNGLYYQAREAERVLMRLELKLPSGDYVTTLQQVNDGDRLWTRRDTPLVKRLTLVELRRVRRVIQDRQLPALKQLALGGMGQLLMALDQQFEFSAPRAGSLGDVPVWVIEGEWRRPEKSDKLAELRQGGEEELPAHVPDRVMVVLSRSENLPLFPFRIEYAREVKGPDAKVHRETLMGVDFYEVTVGGPVDHRLFTYNTGDQDFIDSTDEFIRGL